MAAKRLEVFDKEIITGDPIVGRHRSMAAKRLEVFDVSVTVRIVDLLAPINGREAPRSLRLVLDDREGRAA